MITAWTKNCKSEEEKQQFVNSLNGSKIVLDRMKELLIEMEKDVEDTELSFKSYDTPNWAEKQAHKNGFKNAIRQINKLITLDQKETNEQSTRPK